MTTFICAILAAIIFGAVYLLTLLVHRNRPKCPRCDHQMYYAGEDENDREVWVCSYCGERLLL